MSNHLLQGYRRMMERAKELMAESPNLQYAIDKAKDRAIELKELSEEEANKIASYLKRDLSELIKFTQKEEGTFEDWLAIDELYLEDKLLDLLKTVADPTIVQQLKLKEELQENQTYQAGEIVGFGTLHCTECNFVVPYESISEVTVCPQCGNREFKRQ